MVRTRGAGSLTRERPHWCLRRSDSWYGPVGSFPRGHPGPKCIRGQCRAARGDAPLYLSGDGSRIDITDSPGLRPAGT